MVAELLQYIEIYLLKKGEEIAPLKLELESNSIIDVPIIKRLETKIKTVAMFTCSTLQITNATEHIDVDVMKLVTKVTPNKKIALDEYDEAVALRWIREGWFVKEIRFNKDGRTVDTVYYRMGYRLYLLQQKLAEKKNKQLEDQLDLWKINVLKVIEEVTNNIAIENLKEYIRLLCEKKSNERLQNSFIPEKWAPGKKLKFLHFLSAVLKISLNKEQFDYKEIGAQYFQEIGGSKEFDSFKEDFIMQLEEIIQLPVTQLGLVSLGKITPLYFSGPVEGKFSSYKYGPVHALTDIAIAEEEYSSNASTLWLVENRAILTRIASETNFLRDSKTLLICVDGHVRSSHRNGITQLLKHSQFQQIIVWTDYDKDGLLIAGELYNIINDLEFTKIKFITHESEIIKSWQEYYELVSTLLISKKIEQEEILGSVEDWKNWIQQ